MGSSFSCKKSVWLLCSLLKRVPIFDVITYPTGRTMLWWWLHAWTMKISTMKCVKVDHSLYLAFMVKGVILLPVRDAPHYSWANNWFFNVVAEPKNSEKKIVLGRPKTEISWFFLPKEEYILGQTKWWFFWTPNEFFSSYLISFYLSAFTLLFFK